MVTDLDIVRRRFDEARLHLDIVDRPGRFRRGNVFSLEVIVSKATGRDQERFQLFPAEAVFGVLNVDAKIHQLVLMVHEEAQDFRFREFVDGRWVTRRQQTRERKMKYLVGMDERSYFMAPLPTTSVTTVRNAHEALRSVPVRSFQANRQTRKVRVVRQGEWFFLPVTHEESRRLDRAIRTVTTFIVRKATIGIQPLGKPHVADELVRVGSRQYVRGRVRHPDHKTARLGGWHWVVSNGEERRPAGSQSDNGSVNWID